MPQTYTFPTSPVAVAALALPSPVANFVPQMTSGFVSSATDYSHAASPPFMNPLLPPALHTSHSSSVSSSSSGSSSSRHSSALWLSPNSPPTSGAFEPEPSVEQGVTRRRHFNPFFMFSNQEHIKAFSPAVCIRSKFAKVLWDALSDEEKNFWKQKALNENDEHKRKNPGLLSSRHKQKKATTAAAPKRRTAKKNKHRINEITEQICKLSADRYKTGKCGIKYENFIEYDPKYREEFLSLEQEDASAARPDLPSDFTFVFDSRSSIDPPQVSIEHLHAEPMESVTRPTAASPGFTFNAFSTMLSTQGHPLFDLIQQPGQAPIPEETAHFTVEPPVANMHPTGSGPREDFITAQWSSESLLPSSELAPYAGSELALHASSELSWPNPQVNNGGPSFELSHSQEAVSEMTHEDFLLSLRESIQWDTLGL